MTVDISERKQKDVVILRLEGRMDAASSPLIERKINTLVESGQKKLILNFEGVDYISSAGMRLLLAVTKRLKGLQGEVVLAGLNADVTEVIHMAGFQRVLKICDNEQEAVSLLEGKES